MAPSDCAACLPMEDPMDGPAFDAMTRRFVARRSRRGVLVGVLGLASAGVVRATDAAQVLRRPGEVCRKDGECAAGTCAPPDASGRRRCADGQVGTGCAVGEVVEAGACVCPGLGRSIAPFACCPGGDSGGCYHVDFVLADT